MCNGKVLDRALEEVDQAIALARSKTDEAMAKQDAQLIVDSCVVVAEAAGKGLFGSGEQPPCTQRPCPPAAQASVANRCHPVAGTTDGWLE